jgi:Mg2+-importing ATPase
MPKTLKSPLSAAGTQASAGLTTFQARERLTEAGPNEPVSSRRASGLYQILFLFINPLAIILLVASAISAAAGQGLNASIIALMVLLSAALNFFQTYRSQRAVERIRSEVAPTAAVLRDGNWTEIPRREIVPGDVFRLTAGDLVPADGWLFEVRDLHVQQAALTGESLPVEKQAVDLQTISPDTSDDHKVFLGTSVALELLWSWLPARAPRSATLLLAWPRSPQKPSSKEAHDSLVS